MLTAFLTSIRTNKPWVLWNTLPMKERRHYGGSLRFSNSLLLNTIWLIFIRSRSDDDDEAQISFEYLIQITCVFTLINIYTYIYEYCMRLFCNFRIIYCFHVHVVITHNWGSTRHKSCHFVIKLACKVPCQRSRLNE